MDKKFSVFYKFEESSKWHLWGIYARKGYAAKVAKELAGKDGFSTRVMSDGIIYETYTNSLDTDTIDNLQKEYRTLYWRRNEFDLIAGGSEDPYQIWDTTEYKTMASRMTEIAGELGYVPES